MPAKRTASLIIMLDNHFSNFSVKTGYFLSLSVRKQMPNLDIYFVVALNSDYWSLDWHYFVSRRSKYTGKYEFFRSSI
jgi:hypothetical protein